MQFVPVFYDSSRYLSMCGTKSRYPFLNLFFYYCHVCGANSLICFCGAALNELWMLWEINNILVYQEGF